MKRNKITLLLAAFLLVCGCSDFEEINVNPNNPPTVPANLLFADCYQYCCFFNDG